MAEVRSTWGPMDGAFGTDRRATTWGNALSWAAITFVTIFAFVFAKERLYADSAYFLTQVVKNANFHIINSRWLIPLSQWMALLAVHAGLSMSTVIVLFSLANAVLLIVLYLFVTRVLHNSDAGIVLVATQFVGLTHALFCPIFEFYYGAMLLVVFLALLHSGRSHPTLRIVLLGLLFVLVISSHFMGMLVMLLALALLRIWRYPGLSILFALLLIAQLGQRFAFLSSYESHAFENVGVRLESWGLLWMLAPGRLWEQLVQGVAHYPDTFLLAAIATSVMVRRKDLWGLFIYIGGLITMYVFISLFFPDATHDRYREILDYTPTAWTIIVLGLRVLGENGFRPVILVALTAALVFRIGWSTYVARTYTSRVEWIEERIQFARHQGIRRAVDLEQRTFLPPGRSVAPLAKLNPPEALLLSARQGPDSVVVIVPFTEEMLVPGYSEWLDQQLTRFGTELPVQVDGPYFHMPKDEFRVLR